MSIILSHYNPNEQYKLGCVIGYYNRIELVKNTLQSINNSYVPKNLLFIIIDDGSFEKTIFNLKHNYILIRKDKNYGISHSLAMGWDILYSLGVEYLLNIDSDAEVSSNWISVLNNVFWAYGSNNCIVTGYHGSFPDGSTNHTILENTKTYRIKSSVGGLNIFFHRSLYASLVRKSLTSHTSIASDIDEAISFANLYGSNPRFNLADNKKGWDWGLSFLCQNNNISILCPKKSVVQHRGYIGISSVPEYFEQSHDYKNECVPKIIHQLWKDSNIPAHLKLMQQSVVRHHSDYKYMFWTDELLNDFIRSNYPGMWDFYDKGIEYIIQKIDFVRLLLVYHYGGVYLDLDSLCIKNIDDILQFPCSLINTKKHESFSNKHYPLIINNAFIACEQYNHFIKQIILHIIDYKDPIDYKEYCDFNPAYTKILKSAGPLCITDCYLSYNFKFLIKLLSNNYYYGLDYSKDMEASEIIDYGMNTALKIDDCRFMHMHESSWWKINGKAAAPMPNPNFKTANLDYIKNTAKLELI